MTGEPGAGVSFPNWKGATTTHVGRPPYALAKGAETEKQRRLIAKALKVRSARLVARGSTHTTGLLEPGPGESAGPRPHSSMSQSGTFATGRWDPRTGPGICPDYL